MGEVHKIAAKAYNMLVGIPSFSFSMQHFSHELIAACFCPPLHQNLVALNLWSNKLQDAEIVIQEVTKCRNLKAIWLNDNPVVRNWYIFYNKNGMSL